MSQVSYVLHGSVAVATVENPPVNALSHAVRRGLMDAIGRCQADSQAQALVIIGGGATFVAGADIKDFGKPYVEPTLYDIMDVLMASPKPVIAALHGTAFGGGLELALSCHWRVAVSSAQVGQPEVKLGLMPGGRGTQWWTRLAGPEVALAVCTSGDPVSAAQALEWGVIDKIVDGDLLDGALRFAAEVTGGALQTRKLSESSDKIRGLDAGLFADFRRKHERKWKGLLAPWKIVDCIEAACRLDFAEGAKLERQAFQECESSFQSRSLIHLFFAERAAGKVKHTASAPAAPIRSAAVVGAGTMGGGIAMCVAGNAEGFIGNRILDAYATEADFLLEEGATPWQIDRVLVDFGFPMGLFAMRDMAGLDVCWRIRQQQRATGSRRRPIADEDILHRLLCAMVNEGARILEEGVAQRAGDIDVVYVHGYGFPRHRGGPMWWAQAAGLARIHESISGFHREMGKRWKPVRLLEQAAAGGGWHGVATPA